MTSPHASPPLRTIAQVRADMLARGLTLKAWAVANGFKPEHVEDLLRGKAKGRFGASHRIAVRLGLKHGIADISPLDVLNRK